MAICGLIGEVKQNHLRALPILSCSLCCTNTISAAIFTLLTAKHDEYIKKIGKFLLLAWRMHPLLLLGMTTAPRLA